MIELDVLQQDNSGQVVQELRSFVEKRGVVLIALNHEMRTVCNLKAASEIFGDAADKE